MTVITFRGARLYWPSAFLLMGLMLGGLEYLLVHGGQVKNNQAASVEASVARIRELGFIRPVPLVIKTPEQAQHTMMSQIARDHTDQDLRIGGANGVMTGLYPPDIDLKRQT